MDIVADLDVRAVFCPTGTSDLRCLDVEEELEVIHLDLMQQYLASKELSSVLYKIIM